MTRKPETTVVSELSKDTPNFSIPSGTRQTLQETPIATQPSSPTETETEAPEGSHVPEPSIPEPDSRF